MKQCFVSKSFRDGSYDLIGSANEILDEYHADGFVLTLRQLYYQLVARGLIENSVRSYKRIGGLVSDARLAGLIDWAMIEDRGRELVIPPHWPSPYEILATAANQFAIDKWADQPNHIEVMVEKDALSGVLAPVCRSLDVGFTANKGYSSSSAMYEAGRRIKGKVRAGKRVFILYLGDHDPSGIDMTRDVGERVLMFSGETNTDDYRVLVNRLALNYNQVEALHPPENPAKDTDARYASYVERYGESSWELDAIEPRALASLVIKAVEGLRDADLWVKALDSEDEMRREISEIAEKYRRSHGLYLGRDSEFIGDDDGETEDDL
jgi:hypothetical protein